MLYNTKLTGTTRHLNVIAHSVGDGVSRIQLTSAIDKLNRQHQDVDELLIQANQRIVSLQQENEQLKEELKNLQQG